jgi:hypothetical protein
VGVQRQEELPVGEAAGQLVRGVHREGGLTHGLIWVPARHTSTRKEPSPMTSTNDQHQATERRKAVPDGFLRHGPLCAGHTELGHCPHESCGAIWSAWHVAGLSDEAVRELTRITREIKARSAARREREHHNLQGHPQGRNAPMTDLTHLLTPDELAEYARSPIGKIEALTTELARLQAEHLRLQGAVGAAGKFDRQATIEQIEAAHEHQRAEAAKLRPEFTQVFSRLAGVHARIAGEYAELAALHLEQQ